MYLPPYGLDFNPIEMRWSKLKDSLRKANVCTLIALKAISLVAFGTITLLDITA